MRRSTRRTALLLAVLWVLTAALPAVAETAAVLPDVSEIGIGEVIHGFAVKEVGTFEVLGAPTLLLEHEKTGAQVYYIAADDINRAFNITFRTVAENNHGTPHVFEHITIAGSEKYPAPNLFFPVANQTYNTFVNAFTMANSTSYPLASLSEEQLLKLADVYLDGVFHPLLYQDERLFRQEAWRYELPSADAELTITGTVYNEMKGSSSIGGAAYRDMINTLYPGSLLGNEYGGDPAFIPDLTYEELLAFHQIYYHPSNALVILYGDLELARFLKLMDEDYFSHYEKKAISVQDGDIPAQDGHSEGQFPYPVEAGSPTENESYILYSFAANGATEMERMELGVLASILSHNASPFSVLMQERLPGATYAVSVDTSTPQPTLFFFVTGVNADAAEVFKETVEDAVAQMVAEGLDAELVQAILAQSRLGVLLMPESAALGTDIVGTLASWWARTGGVNYFNDSLHALEALQEKGEDTSGYVGLLEKYVLNNRHSALSITYPQPGLAEEQAKALADKLAAYKGGLTDEEINVLVEKTAEMVELSAAEPPQEIIQDLQAVTVDTLPEEMEIYAVHETERNGVRYLTAPTQAGEVGLTYILLDTAWVPVEDLHYLALLASLFGELDTEQHTKEELALLSTRYLNGYSISVGQTERPEKSYAPGLFATWMGLMDDYETGVALVREILFSTKLDNVEDIQNHIAMLKSNVRYSMSAEVLNYLYIRAQAVFSEASAYESYLTGWEYYGALLEIERQMQENPASVLEKLQSLQSALFNSVDAMAIFVGNENAVKIFEREVPVFFEGMESTVYEKADYSALPRPATREALVVDSAVQYNFLAASPEALALEESGLMAVAGQVLSDAYLTPRIRYDLGAYGGMASLGRKAVLTYSYRDPGVRETFEVYKGLGDFLRNLPLTQEDLDRYIINVYASYAMPIGALNGANQAVDYHLAGREQTEKLQRMKEIKACTVEDLRGLADAFDLLNEIGVHSTGGGAGAVEANADLYDQILRIE